MERNYHLLKKQAMDALALPLTVQRTILQVDKDKADFIDKLMNTISHNNEWDAKEQGCVAIWHNFILDTDLIKVACITPQADLFVLEYGNEYVAFVGDRCEKIIDFGNNFIGKHYRTTVMAIIEYQFSPESEFLLNLAI